MKTPSIETVNKQKKHKQDAMERVYNQAAYDWAFAKAAKAVETASIDQQPLQAIYLPDDYKHLPKSLCLLYNSMITLLVSEILENRQAEVAPTEPAEQVG